MNYPRVEHWVVRHFPIHRVTYRKHGIGGRRLFENVSQGDYRGLVYVTLSGQFNSTSVKGLLLLNGKILTIQHMLQYFYMVCAYFAAFHLQK